MLNFKGAYVNGRFAKAKEKGLQEKRDPGNLDQVIGEWTATPEQVDPAVEAAGKAKKQWFRLPAKERYQHLIGLQSVFKERAGELAQIISAEMGKILPESEAEVAASIRKIDVTLSEGMKLVEETRQGSNGYSTRYHPRGVLAILGPFNFPLHLPNGQWVAALATGNTVIFKPSELTPFTGQLIAECFHQAGFPPGVFNLVQGAGDVGAQLAKHADIQGVIFVGSDATGHKIEHAISADLNKICVLEMGGKNAAIIFEDAPIDKALTTCTASALSTTGQRCNALSRIIIHEDLVTDFTVELSSRVLEWISGHYTDKAAMMGPLVSEAALKKFLKYQEKASKEGARSVLKGRAISKHPPGYYVLPSIHRIDWQGPGKDRKGYRYDEIFGPDIAIYTFKKTAEAIAMHNDTRYGLVASVFTKKKNVFERMYRELEVGDLRWNKPTITASGMLPFGGVKASGNNHPAGLFSPLYCTYPVAIQM